VIRSTSSSVNSSSRRLYSLIVFADSWQAIRWAFFNVPPLVRELVMPVARKPWQQTGVLTSASRARRWIIFYAAYRVIRSVESTLALPTAERLPPLDR
jgi:hypothetical protein